MTSEEIIRWVDINARATQALLSVVISIKMRQDMTAREGELVTLYAEENGRALECMRQFAASCSPRALDAGMDLPLGVDNRRILRGALTEARSAARSLLRSLQSRGVELTQADRKAWLDAVACRAKLLSMTHER